MTSELVESLEQAFVKLIAALDGQSADKIIDAAAAIRPIILEVEATGAWHEAEPVKQKIQNLSRLVDASRYRVNKLTDINRHRLHILTQAKGAMEPQTYQRPR